MAKWCFIVLDRTKLPAPVWRCSSEEMESSASGRCRGGQLPGASAAIRWPARPKLHRLPLERGLQTWQNDAALCLILPFLIPVADFALLVRHKENHLTQPFIGVNLRRQRCGVADFQSYEAFPLRLEGRDVDDDAAACVGGFAHANRQHVARNAEILDRACQRKRIRRNDANVAFEFHERSRIEMLGIDNGGVYVRENAELVRHTDVVAVGRYSVTDHAFAHLAVRQRLDHLVLQRHAPDPAVWLDGHPFLPKDICQPCFDNCRDSPQALDAKRRSV